MKKVFTLVLILGLFTMCFIGSVNAEAPVFYTDDESVETIELHAEFISNRLQLSWDQPTEYNIDYYEILRSSDNSQPTSKPGSAAVILNSIENNSTTDRGNYIDDELSSGVSYYRICVYTEQGKRGCGNVVSTYGMDRIVLAPNVDGFPDIEGHWGEQYIEKLRVLNVVEGRNGNFEPNSNILRAEAIKILMLAFRLGGTSCQPGWFPDMSATDWFCDVVSEAAVQGYVEGDQGMLYPGREITRAEAVKVVLEIKGIEIPEITEDPFDDVDHTLWYAKYIAKAKELEIVEGVGDNKFEPNRSITRAELSKIAVEAAGL